MEKQVVRDALKNVESQNSQKALENFAREEFGAKFRDCNHTLYQGFEIINNKTIKVVYSFFNNSEKQTGGFIVEL
jgi:hypothetical protein